jgi:hypothetical protein
MATAHRITQLRCETCRLPWIVDGAYTPQQARALVCRYCQRPLTWVKLIRRPTRPRRHEPPGPLA